jgi:purine-binding chemotaxis protein CheW
VAGMRKDSKSNYFDGLLSDSESLAVLNRRSEEMAKEQKLHDDSQIKEDFIHFRLGQKDEYGIPYRIVEEVISVSKITKVPCTPSFIAGVVNRRGEMLSVLDLYNLLGIEKTLDKPNNFDVVVIRSSSSLVGIRVDDLIGNDEFEPNSLTEPLESDRQDNSKFVLGIHQGKITMLDFEKLLESSILQVNKKID